MEQQNPPWLTTEFLQQSLQNDEKYSKITITSFKASPGAPPGNNYGSIVLRVNIDYREDSDPGKLHSLSVIIKGPVTTGKMSEMLSDIGDCEPMFYCKYIPEVYKLYKCCFAPKHFFSPVPSVTVLEDLKEQGYLMADRIKQLDFEHCKLYMTAAASFHAASIGVKKNNPELIDTIGRQKLFLNDLSNTNIWRKILKLGHESLAKRISNKKHSKLIKDFGNRVWDLLVEVHKPCGLINTLNQGDPWSTNMMFRYDESGKVSAIKLLDFQIPMYTSPLHDIIFFIWSSAQHEVRKHKLEELYYVYIEHFNKVVRQLGYSETLTYKTFLEEAERMTPTAMWIIAMICFLMNPSATDFNSVISKVEQYDGTSENPFEQYYTDSFCQNQLPQYLEDMESAGIFAYFETMEKSNN